MKGESCSPRKLLLLWLSWLLLVSLCACHCNSHRDCPGDQVCSKTNHTQAKICSCRQGYVLWKWQCFNLVPDIGGSCVVSKQCQVGGHCDPLSLKCSCPVGSVETRGQCLSLSMAAKNQSMHEKLVEGILANVNKTLRNTLKGGHPEAERSVEWTKEQLQTVVYIALAFACVICVAIISALYMRSLREKRRSAAAIRSLLDLMAENRSLQSVYTLDGLCHQNEGGQQYSSVSDNQLERPADVTKEGRIHLPPLEGGEVKMPSPHLSAPVLPPIKRPRPMSANKAQEKPSTDTVKSIRDNLEQLNEADLLRKSAASFPSDSDSDTMATPM